MAVSGKIMFQIRNEFIFNLKGYHLSIILEMNSGKISGDIQVTKSI